MKKFKLPTPAIFVALFLTLCAVLIYSCSKKEMIAEMHGTAIKVPAAELAANADFQYLTNNSKSFGGELSKIYVSVLAGKLKNSISSTKGAKPAFTVSNDESARLHDLAKNNPVVKEYARHLAELEKVYPGISRLSREEYRKVFNPAAKIYHQKPAAGKGSATVSNVKVDSCNTQCELDYQPDYDENNYFYLRDVAPCGDDYACQDAVWATWWAEVQWIDHEIYVCKDNCYNNYIYTGVSYNSTTGMLEFASLTDFNDIVEKLENDFEAHQAAFFDSRDSWSDDDINDYAESIGFDEFAPLRAFETQFGLSSLRQQIEDETEAWLDHSTISASDFPEDNYGVEDVIEQTLFNEDSQVKIGGTISGPISTPIITAYTDCFYRGRYTDGEEYSSSPVKKVLKKLVVDGNSGWIQGARFKGKCISFKKSGNRFKKYATSMSVRIYGDAYIFATCNQPINFDDSNTAKRRYHRKLKHTIPFGNDILDTRPGHFTGEFNINGSTKTLAF